MILDRYGKTIKENGLGNYRQLNLNQYLQWLTAEPASTFVSPLGSLQLSTVYACIKLLADSIAMTPLKFYEKRPESRERTEITRGVFANLAKQACPLFNNFTFWQSMLVSLNGWGNAYAVIIRQDGVPEYLIYLAPNQVSFQDTSDPRYEFLRGDTPFVYQVNTGMQTLYVLPEDMVHIISFSYDGLTGCSPVQLHQDTFQVENEQTKYGRSFYSTGGKITGVIESPRQTSRQDAIEFVTWFNEFYGGSPGQTGSGRIAFLPNGLVFKQASVVNPQDAEYVKARELTRKEIASIYRVPPYLIGDLDRATWSNVTQLSEEFVRYTLNPLYTVIETELNKKLLENSPTLYYEFDSSILLRGTVSERYSNYSVGIESGFLSPAEVREKEGLPYVEGLEYFNFSNPQTEEPVSEEDEEIDVEDDRQMEMDYLIEFRDKQLQKNFDMQLDLEKIKLSTEKLDFRMSAIEEISQALKDLRSEVLQEVEALRSSIESEVNELRSDIATYSADNRKLNDLSEVVAKLQTPKTRRSKPKPPPKETESNDED